MRKRLTAGALEPPSPALAPGLENLAFPGGPAWVFALANPKPDPAQRGIKPQKAR